MRIQLTKIIGMAAAGVLLTAASAWADDYPPPPPPPAVVTPPSNIVVTPPSPTVAPAPAPAPVVVNPTATQTEVTRPYGTALIGGGAALLGITYTATVIGAGVAEGQGNCNPGTSSIGCPTRYWPMYVPVAGPFIELGSWNGNNSGAGKALLAVDGSLQAIGAAMLVTGIIEAAATGGHVRETVSSRPSKKSHHFAFSPFASATSAGVGAMGSF